MSQQTSRKRRSDADLNRLRILRAARRAYATDGLDVPVRRIAGHAGLGTATLYRHFPSRTDLLEAVLAERVAACEADLAAACAAPHAWAGLSRLIHRFAELQVTDRAVNQLLLGSHDAVLTARRREHAHRLEVLVARARAAGDLREGVTADDVRAGLLGLAALGALPPGDVAGPVRRLAGLTVAGLRR